MPGCLLDIYVTVLPDGTEALSQDMVGTAYSTVASQTSRGWRLVQQPAAVAYLYLLITRGRW